MRRILLFWYPCDSEGIGPRESNRMRNLPFTQLGRHKAWEQVSIRLTIRQEPTVTRLDKQWKERKNIFKSYIKTNTENKYVQSSINKSEHIHRRGRWNRLWMTGRLLTIGDKGERELGRGKANRSRSGIEFYDTWTILRALWRKKNHKSTRNTKLGEKDIVISLIMVNISYFCIFYLKKNPLPAALFPQDLGRVCVHQRP